MAGNLYIPVEDADDGTQRPYPTNTGTPPWASANIRISYLGVEGTKAYAQKDNKVVVRVKNKGAQSMANVKVQAWVFEPGIGMNRPGDAIFPFTYEGTQTLDPNARATFTMKEAWNPGPEVLGGAAEKHFCLMANVYQAGGANPEGKELLYTNTDPSNKVDVDNNQHHGQCNIVLLPASQAPSGGGTNSKVPTTTFPPRGGSAEFRVRADHVTTKPEASQLAVLKAHPGIVPGGGTAPGGLSLMTSKGPVPITLSTETPGFDLRSEVIPGLDTPFRFSEDRPDKIPTDIEVRLPEGAPLGSLHIFDLGLWTERGDLVGGALRVMILVTE
ncbi:hypothetical protein ACWD3J_41575 [Streptomyces sp. NPDC002755]|uniref:hypothetical protein n=1 Tax=Streptomyces sp. NPDC002884 TaxID=3154544 RepID=UPI0033196A6A